MLYGYNWSARVFSVLILKKTFSEQPESSLCQEQRRTEFIL